MQANTDNATNKVNPTEMRFLRTAVDATATRCRLAAMQAVVSYASLALGLDLRQEAKALEAEYELLAHRPAMSLSTSTVASL